MLSAAVLPTFFSCKKTKLHFLFSAWLWLHSYWRLCLFDSWGRLYRERGFPWQPLCGTQKTCLVYSISSKVHWSLQESKILCLEGCAGLPHRPLILIVPVPILALSLASALLGLSRLSLISPYWPSTSGFSLITKDITLLTWEGVDREDGNSFIQQIFIQCQALFKSLEIQQQTLPDFMELLCQ